MQRFERSMATGFAIMIGGMLGLIVGSVCGYFLAAIFLPVAPDARPEDYLQQWPFLLEVLFRRGTGILIGAGCGTALGGLSGYFTVRRLRGTASLGKSNGETA